METYLETLDPDAPTSQVSLAGDDPVPVRLQHCGPTEIRTRSEPPLDDFRRELGSRAQPQLGEDVGEVAFDGPA